MAKITQIEPQKRKGRVNVYVDGNFSFGLSEMLLIEYGIYSGREITAAEIEKFKNGDDLQKCLEKAYRLLGFRQRSEKELVDKLSEKFEIPTIKKAIEKLREYKYINDIEFARAWIADRKAGRSKKALAFELKRKGIAEETIEDALTELDGEAEFEAALELVKKRKKYQGLTKEEAYSKIGGFLSRRGYSYEIIKKVLNVIILK